MLGVAGLKERLERLDPSDPGTIPQQLLDLVRNEHRENLGEEEATVYLCQVTTNRVPWKDNVLAPFRLLRSVTDRTSFS